MLYIYSGSDIQDVRKNALQKIDTFVTEGYVLERIEGERFVPGLLANLTESVSLFGDRPVYLLDTPSEYEDFFTELLENRKTLQASPFPFVVIEHNLPAADKKKFSVAEKLEVYTQEKIKKFDLFSLTEALARRDKKQLWVLLQEARRANHSGEEIIGLLWWQLKTIRLAQVTQSADEAGVKPYPYQKAKQALRQYSEEELQVSMQSLLQVYHDGHGGIRDMEYALEQWVLGL